MKLFNVLITTVALTFGANAHALLILQVSETANFAPAFTYTDTDFDLDGQTFVNGLSGVHAAGNAEAFFDDQNYNELAFGAISERHSPGTIYVRITETDLTKNGAYSIAYAGLNRGEVSFQSYLDTSNTAFGQGTLLSDTGSINDYAFSGVDSGYINTVAPYSLSIYSQIEHRGFSVVGYSIKVAEPSILALLGLGLIGIAMTRRSKRRNTQA